MRRYPFPTAPIVVHAFAAILAFASGCQTAPPNSDAAVARGSARRLAATRGSADEFGATDFGRRLGSKNFYFANLHAHHFMGVRGSKKKPLSLAEALAPGECKAEHGTYPMDDGRPCRDEGDQENTTIPPRRTLADGSPDLADYFRQACEYGTGAGELDILFVTPHTKNGDRDEGERVTSTDDGEMRKRQSMLADVNPDRLGAPTFLCGLGQEASSISAGNHLNIFGQFHAGAKNESPFLFASGDFKSLYPAVRARNAADARVFLQMNHPDAGHDLFWGDFTAFAENKKLRKEKLNDYGLDDFAPIGCLIGKLPADTPECAGVSGERLTPELLKKTFANIRDAAGDPFRLIEVIPPGDAKEGGGEAADENPVDRTEPPFGATTNSRTTFRSVHHRKSADTYESGVYDWIFYLSMGFKLGPTANQDNHHMNWGSATASRTGVLAENLREETVLAALAARHVFASEDRNAKILLSAFAGEDRFEMGDTLAVDQEKAKVEVAYYDPDAGESTAQVRLYYYREGDALDFTSRNEAKSVYRTVSFGGDHEMTLPTASTDSRGERDRFTIRNGEVISLALPLNSGRQWIFAEIIQDSDFDKIWSAPIWIERK